MRVKKLDEEDKKQKMDFITKKDLVYIIIFLILLLILLFTLNFEDPKYLTDQLSLGATIFSIFLAVVAILITFIQSNESSRQSSEMTKQINNQTQEISKFSVRYNELMSLQRSLSEQTSQEVLKKVEENDSVPEILKNEIKKIIDEEKSKQDLIYLQKSFINNEISSLNNRKMKSNKFDNRAFEVYSFIKDNYPANMRVTVEKLQEDLKHSQSEYNYSVKELREIIRTISYDGFLKYIITSHKDGSISGAFERMS